MPARPRIDDARLRDMLKAGRSTTEISEALGVTPNGVQKYCHRHKLPLPGRPKRPRMTELPADEPAPVVIPADASPRLAGLIATGGRYGDLARWAAEWGVGMIRARQEWHRLGLPIRKGAAG